MRFERCFGCMEKTQDSDGICPHCGFDAAHYAEAEYVLRPGTILQGRYVIGKLLGKGGFGITYIGYDMSLDIRVAIKEYYPEGLVGRNAKQSSELIWYSSKTDARHAKNSRESLLKEARSMAKIDSFQTVARVRDVFMANETAYLVMDYIDGVTLKKEVMERGILNYDRMRTYLLPIMRDLAEIHEAGIIHRDISPDNIMLEPSGKVRLLDLGAAKDLYKTAAVSGEDVPESTQMVLKHGFSPLEQYKMHGDIGPWTDVYALTATIYYLVPGRVLPTPMDRLDEEPEKMVQNMISRLSMPEKAKEGMRKGLAILKKDRIKSMHELAEYFTEATPQPAPKPQPQPDPKPVFEPKREAQPEPKMQSEPRAAAKPQLAPEEQFKPPLEMKVDRGDDFKKGIVLLVGGILLVGGGYIGLRSMNEIRTAKVQAEKDEKAAELYQQEAEAGNAEAMKNLGLLYEKGSGVEQNYEKAAELYQQAADLKNADAMFCLGLMYERGNGVERSYGEAAEWYQQAADLKNADAMYKLGWLYLNALGVKCNYEKAIEWYQQAIDLGNADAMCELGGLYEEGKGVKQNYEKAAELYQQAADYGNGFAMCELGFMYGCGLGVETNGEKAKKLYRQAMELCQQAAEAGNVEAMKGLACMYSNSMGVEKNYKKAAKWYQQAADLGDADAMCELGWLYEYGTNGVERNYEKGVELFRQAADAGHTQAMCGLGFMYRIGEGVERNPEKAVEWYQQAVSMGNVGAMYELGKMYENGESVEQSYKKAIELYKQSAAGGYGDVWAMYGLGKIYEEGECGQKKDLEEALKWYKLTAERQYTGKTAAFFYREDALDGVERVQQALQNANGN